jgi:hypothetical protein
VNISAVQISHATVVVAVEFAKLITTFESLLGKYDPTVADQIRNDPQAADRTLQAMEGEQNLMIFSKLNHGGLFRLIGQSRNAARYTIGNPRIALQMTRHDIGAALYVPSTSSSWSMKAVRSGSSMTCPHRYSGSSVTRRFFRSPHSLTKRSSDSSTPRSEQPLCRFESRPSRRLRNKDHFVQEWKGLLDDSPFVVPS